MAGQPGKSGGARPRAGRKPKGVKYARDINAAEKQIRDHLPDIVAAQIALAKGLKTTTTEGDIYTTIPDKVAGQYLMNRIMGSPIQKQEISGSIDTILVKYVDQE